MGNTFRGVRRTFLQFSSRVFDSANYGYANYVVERLEVCIITLATHTLKENFEEKPEDDRGIRWRYLDNIKEVLGVCRTFTVKWEQNLVPVQQTHIVHVNQLKCILDKVVHVST